MEDHVEIIAHRGASGAAPENTMAAFRQAIVEEADWIELDVQESADGEIVVFHDSDFMKLSGVNTKIWDAKRADLNDIDIGSWFSDDYADERVPTLAQVFEEFGQDIRIVIELKYYGHDQQLEQRVIDLVEEHEMAQRVQFMSLKSDAVTKMKELRPDWKVGQLLSASIGNVRKSPADFLAINAGFATPALIHSAHAAGKDVYVWTVNDAVSMSTMISRGVDGLITDDPALARSVLNQRAELSTPQRLLLEFAEVIGMPPSIQEQ